MIEEGFAFVEFFCRLGFFESGEVEAGAGLARQRWQKLVVDRLDLLGLRLGVEHEFLAHDAHGAALLVKELGNPVGIARVLVDVEEPVIGGTHIVVTCSLQFGDFGIDGLGVQPHRLARAQHVRLEPGFDVLAHHRQAVKRLGDHAFQQHRRLSDEGQAGGDGLEEGDGGLPVGRNALQLIAKAARLGLRQDDLLSEVRQDGNDRCTDLALHAFKDGRKAREVVVEDLGCTGHVFRHHEAQALGFFHQRSNALSSLVEEGNDGQTFLAEELDSQCSLVRTIRHVGEFLGQIEQDGFGGTNLPMRIHG